jgi:hypothetical protein
MMRGLFRQFPSHSLLVHAAELQNNGNFGEVTRAAWSDAFDKWTGEFGQDSFASEIGNSIIYYHLEMNEDDIVASAQEQKCKVEELQNLVDSSQKLVNYRYWRTRALSESEPLTEDAHREIYEGQQAFKEAKLTMAKQRLESGMAKFAQVLSKYPSIAVEDDAIDESLKAMLYWRYILQLQQEPIPRDYPLSFIWNKNQPRVAELDRRFKIENGLQ